MIMLPFYKVFPEIAEEETRSLVCQGRNDLPDGEFGFLEFFCSDKDCDCQRLVMTVRAAEHPDKTMATINYGWESLSFYEKWFGDRKLARMVKGPFLDPLGEQSCYAPRLLYLFKNLLLKDRAYVARLKLHYEMFKNRLREQVQIRLDQFRFNGQKIGRNERCHCGSNLKFKNCCGNLRENRIEILSRHTLL